MKTEWSEKKQGFGSPKVPESLLMTHVAWARIFSSLYLIHKMKELDKMIPKDTFCFQIPWFGELPVEGVRCWVARSSK